MSNNASQQDESQSGSDFILYLFGDVFSCQNLKQSSWDCPCGQPNKSSEQHQSRKPQDRTIQSKKPNADQNREIMNLYQTLTRKQDSLDSHSNQTSTTYKEREPNPVAGWTLEDQRLLIAADKALQRDRLQLLESGVPEDRVMWNHLRQIARRVPGKSAEECGRCLKHVEKTRIAYFGNKHAKGSLSS